MSTFWGFYSRFLVLLFPKHVNVSAKEVEILSLQGGITEKRPLTEAEVKRLERFARGKKNRRGRKWPSSIPARLARTAAFAPKRRGLITDSGFVRLYVVPGHSAVKVSGRELGSQHRDAIYAVFRLPRETVTIEGVSKNPFLRFRVEHQTVTTWRELLEAMGRKAHVNNAMTLKEVFEEIKRVAVTVYADPTPGVLEGLRRGVEPVGAGALGSIIDEVIWEGVELDSRVKIVYGGHAVEAIQRAMLVSLNSDVQFRLKSDHAKSFWPYIDSMNGHSYVDETMLACLAGRDLWAEHETSATRAQFRKDCRQAFADMVRADGLKNWRVEVRGTGQKKWHRYHYEHALVRQLELELASPSVAAPSPDLTALAG